MPNRKEDKEDQKDLMDQVDLKDLEKGFKKLAKRAERLEQKGVKSTSAHHKKTLDNLRLELAKLYEKHGVDGRISWEEMNKYDRLKKLDSMIQKEISDLYASTRKDIRATLNTIAQDTYRNSITIVEKATGRKLRGIVKKLNVANVVNDDMAGLEWITRTNNHRHNFIYKLSSDLKGGLKRGDTYKTLSRKLKEETQISANKANVIIRTEGHRVHSQARKDSLDAVSKQGVKMYKTWVSSHDERVREQHQDMDGVEIPYEEDFVLPDGTTGSAPALTGEAHHDINCRCIITVRMREE